MNSAEMLQRIQGLLKLHQTKDARPLIEELIHAEPSHPEVWYWRGVCERFDGELDLAENDFRSVIRLKPNHTHAFYGLGDVLEHQGKHQEAIAAYQKAASWGNQEAAKKLTQYGISSVDDRSTVLPHLRSQRLLQKVAEVELNSEKGIDYSRLHNLLASKQWKKADQETEKLMYRAAGRAKAQWGNLFPCTDLITLDNLWTYYSQGRFGFSVQREIWQRRCEGGRKFNHSIWNRFGASVGWMDKGIWATQSELSDFDESAPRGHLPVSIWAPQKSDIALSCLESWWMLPQNQKMVKAQKREAGWHGAELISLLFRLEFCTAQNSSQLSQPLLLTTPTRNHHPFRAMFVLVLGLGITFFAFVALQNMLQILFKILPFSLAAIVKSIILIFMFFVGLGMTNKLTGKAWRGNHE
jgi:tetratricopeptide (TPR) repeat protein